MISFVKTSNVAEDTLSLIIHRAVTYNKILKNYTNSYYGKVAVPEKDLRKLRKIYSTVDEYINSDKKLFDDINVNFLPPPLK